ncbi:TetR/AcrR family transcriptional regulator [Brevibacterium album]|uniref:TetR/AcrR family transcriptional regulator n=1 Tax=Brevibacterium album TaxID=417948 RepID=UPI00040C409B|nr:TetR/AcrR family transcriptional regulator [Brevibacterium album]
MARSQIGDADWAAARAIRREHDSATKTALLRGARAVFSRRGYAGATIGEIAAAAEVSRPSFYVYFATKAEVFRGVAEQLREELLEAHHHTGATADDPVLLSRASTEAFITVYVESLELVEEIANRAEHDARVREIFEETVSRPAHRTRGHIRSLVDAGLAQPRVTVEYAAGIMRAVLMDAAREIRRAPGQRDHVIDQATRLYLAVIGYRGPLPEGDLRMPGPDAAVPEPERATSPDGGAPDDAQGAAGGG